MTMVIDFTTAFISEHGSSEMLKLWNSKTTQAELKKTTTSAKKIKDPQAPKKPLSAYMYFCKDQRAAVTKDKGDDAKATEVTTELGVRWNALKADHSKGKTKKQWDAYETEAADDKKRYEAEMADYTPPSDEELAAAKKAAEEAASAEADVEVEVEEFEHGGKNYLKNTDNLCWLVDEEGNQTWAGVFLPEEDRIDESVEEPTA